jgi:hypothetical protein
MTFLSEERRIREIYVLLAQWGVNVEAIREIGLTARQLEDFFQAIYALMAKQPGWLDESN